MPRHRLSPLLVAALALAAVVSCGGRQKQLQVALGSLNAARDGFVAWDERTQQRIVDSVDVSKPESVDATTKALQDHRASRDKVMPFFLIAYSAMTLAALDLDEKSLMEAIKQARVLYEQIKLITTGVVNGQR